MNTLNKELFSEIIRSSFSTLFAEAFGPENIRKLKQTKSPHQRTKEKALDRSVKSAGGRSDVLRRIRQKKHVTQHLGSEGERAAAEKRRAQNIERTRQAKGRVVNRGTEKLRGSGERKAPMSRHQINRSRGNPGSIERKTTANTDAFNRLVTRLSGVGKKRS